MQVFIYIIHLYCNNGQQVGLPIITMIFGISILYFGEWEGWERMHCGRTGFIFTVSAGSFEEELRTAGTLQRRVPFRFKFTRKKLCLCELSAVLWGFAIHSDLRWNRPTLNSLFQFPPYQICCPPGGGKYLPWYLSYQAGIRMNKIWNPFPFPSRI